MSRGTATTRDLDRRPYAMASAHTCRHRNTKKTYGRYVTATATGKRARLIVAERCKDCGLELGDD